MKATDNKLWYAVVNDNDDTDWGYGSRSLTDALQMARELRDAGRADAHVVVIDDGVDPTAIDLIYLDD